MDGTVTKILKDVRRFLSKRYCNYEAMQLRSRVEFAINLNTKIDSIIDSWKKKGFKNGRKS